MRKSSLPFVLIAILILSACGQAPEPPQATAQPFSTATATTPAPPGTGEEDFDALDATLFLWAATRDARRLRALLAEPAAYGIDRTLVPQTLGDLSETAATRYAAECQTHIESLYALPDGLSAQKQAAAEAALAWLEAEEQEAGDWLYYEPFSPQTGLHCEIPAYFLHYVLRDAADAELYLTLLADLPRYFAQAAEWAQTRATEGLFMTAPALELVLSECETLISEPVLSSLQDSFSADLAALSLSEEKVTELTERHAALLRDAYIPAYQDLAQVLRALAPLCREGKQSGSGADAWFARALAREAGAQISPAVALELLEARAELLYFGLEGLYILHPSIPIPPPLSAGRPPASDAVLRFAGAHDTLPALLYIPGTIDAPAGHFALRESGSASSLLWAHESAHAADYIGAMENPDIPLFQKTLSFAAVWEGRALATAQAATAHLGETDKDVYLMAFYFERYEDICGAIASILVNAFNYDANALRAYLAEREMEIYTDFLYAMALDNPLHFLRYAIGYAQIIALEETGTPLPGILGPP
ncbi:MAG: DUF885 family protein [Clostridiales bacterium]|nr:DUF885 family protein [Clostridiales bacterium]